jgi:hypothetical protein
MARIPRVLYRLFGVDGPTADFGTFGSKAAGAPVYTKDVAVIQSLDAWANGWKNALLTGERQPFLEDWNAKDHVHGYMLAYLMQEGVPEWNVNTEYHQNSIVKKPGTFELYASIVNNNTGNALPTQTDDVNWKFLFPVRTSQLLGTITDAQIDEVAAAKITGQVSDAQIAAMATSKLLGMIQNAQVQSLAFSKLTGQASTAQIADGAISQVVSSGFNKYGPDLGSALVATASITTTGGSVLAFSSFEGISQNTVPIVTFGRRGNLGSTVGGRIKLGGYPDWCSIPLSLIDTPAAGTWSYDLKASSLAQTAGNVRLIELKK